MEIPTEYPFNISNEQVSDMYSLLYIIYHDVNYMSTGHYYSDILDFNTGVFWQCNDENMTQIEVMSYDCYINVTLKYTSIKE